MRREHPQAEWDPGGQRSVVARASRRRGAPRQRQPQRGDVRPRIGMPTKFHLGHETERYQLARVPSRPVRVDRAEHRRGRAGRRGGGCGRGCGVGLGRRRDRHQPFGVTRADPPDVPGRIPPVEGVVRRAERVPPRPHRRQRPAPREGGDRRIGGRDGMTMTSTRRRRRRHRRRRRRRHAGMVVLDRRRMRRRVEEEGVDLVVDGFVTAVTRGVRPASRGRRRRRRRHRRLLSPRRRRHRRRRLLLLP